MDFDLSEDEEMLKALAERFVLDRYDAEKRRSYLAQANGFSPENWQMFSELGLLGAFFEEDNGGLGIGDSALAVMFEALGRGLVVEPIIDNIVLAAKLFEQTATGQQKDEWLETLVSGERRIALAHFEPQSRGDAARVRCKVEAAGSEFEISGEKSLVAGGSGVDAYLVSALQDGEIALFLVPADADGLSSTAVRTADGAVGVALTLDSVRVDTGARLDASLDDITRALGRAQLARCAESLGIMEAVFAETQDYLRQREQFGVPLSRFQVLQHRMVEQYATIAQARALVDLAVAAGKGDEAQWLHRIAGAHAYIGEKSVELGHEMIQFHGAMGVSDELWIGPAHKRLFMNSRYTTPAKRSFDMYAGAA